MDTGTKEVAHRRSLIVVVGLVLAWILFVYQDTVAAMLAIWIRSETFTHCFLVPPIVAWLIWQRREVIAQNPPKPSYWALGLTCLLGLSWLLGESAAVNSVTQLSLVGMIVATVPVLFGWHITSLILFPLAFAFFAVPIGEFLMQPFMEWTADVTIWALRLSGIPVYREGLQFVIPTGSWSVVEACSGIRYLIASFTVGTLFAYLNYQSSRRRMVFMLVSAVVPIVANWMRAYMIVMLGHLSGNRLAVGVDHLIYGWVFFGVVILLMFFVGARWAQPVANSPSPGPTSAIKGNTNLAPRVWPAAVALSLVVALAPGVNWWLAHRAPGGPVSLAQASLQAGWSVVDGEKPKFEPGFENPSAKSNQMYGRDGQQVGVYVAYYRDQNYQRKLVSANNVLVRSTDNQWSVTSRKDRVVTVDGRAVRLRTAELRRLPLDSSGPDSRLVVWQMYWINGTWTSSDYLAKVYSAVLRLLGLGDESAVIVMYTPQSSGADATSVLNDFLSTQLESIAASLRETSARR